MNTWSELLKSNLLSIDQLQSSMKLTQAEKENLERVSERHPMCITKYYFDLIDWNDPNDPIRKLSIPSALELIDIGSEDTSEEENNTKFPGLQHKYQTTVLIVSTNVCYMYCRHCFRKRMVGYTTDEINTTMLDSVSYIQDHPEVNNVLISGGDAFTLSNESIKKYLVSFTSIKHLDFIRFGTRVPVVFPHRIFMDKELLNILQEYCKIKTIIVVTQFDHPKEITEESTRAIKELVNAGIIVKNQTVLLKDVNDNADILSELFSKLTSIGVSPYYIFQCRPVKYGTHFQVTFEEGLKILMETRKNLNGMSKGFRYVMSHPRGKIEILGVINKNFVFKFHQAKNQKDEDVIFFRPIKEKACWLDEKLELT